MAIGIRRFYVTPANQAITSSAALVSLGLSTPIAANQTVKVRYVVPFSVGATGGVRVQVAVPAGGTAFVAAIYLANTVAPSVTNAVQTTSAAFTNALANAGNHFLIIDVTVVNGATAGVVDLQGAQNTSDALTLTFLRGATADVVVL